MAKKQQYPTLLEVGKQARAEAEQKYIIAVLERSNGVGEAARHLGISRTTLWKKMKKYGICVRYERSVIQDNPKITQG